MRVVKNIRRKDDRILPPFSISIKFSLTIFFQQDGYATNIDSTNPEIDTKTLTASILDQFLIGFSHQASDMNIWDYALEKNEMKKWTTCR